VLATRAAAWHDERVIAAMPELLLQTALVVALGLALLGAR
jgi:hypothetical protein